MNRTWIGISACGVAIVLVGCGTAEKMAQEKGYVSVTHAELEQMYSRTRTIAWSNPGGNRGTATYHPDGTAAVTWPGGEDEGRWRIDDGRFCNQWKTVRNGVENCTRSYKVGANKYRAYNADGTLATTISYMN